MQNISPFRPKRLVGAAALLLLVSASFGAYAGDDPARPMTPAEAAGSTPAAAAATANMNAGQVNNQPTYTVTSPAPGTVEVTHNPQPASATPPGPPPQAAPTQAAGPPPGASPPPSAPPPPGAPPPPPGPPPGQR